MHISLMSVTLGLFVPLIFVFSSFQSVDALSSPQVASANAHLLGGVDAKGCYSSQQSFPSTRPRAVCALCVFQPSSLILKVPSDLPAP